MNMMGARILEYVYQQRFAQRRKCCVLVHCLDAESSNYFFTIWSFLSHSFSEFKQDFNIIFLINRLSMRDPYNHYYSCNIKKKKKIRSIAFNFDLFIYLFWLSVKLESFSAPIVVLFQGYIEIFIFHHMQ